MHPSRTFMTKSQWNLGLKSSLVRTTKVFSDRVRGCDREANNYQGYIYIHLAALFVSGVWVGMGC